MPLVYTVGAIVGPTLGGALSNPLGTDPSKPRGDKFFERFPYCLPNLVGSAFFMIGIVTGFLFLKETLESRKNKPDYGLMLGNKITAWVRKTFNEMLEAALCVSISTCFSHDDRISFSFFSRLEIRMLHD